MSQVFDLLDTPIGDGITVVEASAGTGKTYCLTGLVLRLLLERQVENLGQVLVVTFTQAATDELVGRIRTALRDTYAAFQREEGDDASDPEPFVRQLVERHRDGGADILRRALLDFDELNVSTLHGFCKRVLEEHAFDSGLPFDPELVTRDDGATAGSGSEISTVGFGSVAELADGVPREDLAQVRPEALEQAEIVHQQRRDGLLVQHAEVVGLEERVDRDLPVDRLLGDARVVVVIAREIVARELRCQLAQVCIYVHRALRIQPGPTQIGGYADAVVSVALRLETVDYNRGTFSSTAESIGDEVTAVVPGLSFRPSASTVFRANYRYHWVTDFQGNDPARVAGFQFGFATYF